MHKIIFLFPEKKNICVPTLPKISRPVTRNTLIFYLAWLVAQVVGSGNCDKLPIFVDFYTHYALEYDAISFICCFLSEMICVYVYVRCSLLNMCHRTYTVCIQVSYFWSDQLETKYATFHYMCCLTCQKL